jgi:PBP1b-binding outer membrane lipoprotein LpoB
VRTYVRRAFVPAALISAVLLTGCSSESSSGESGAKQEPAAESPLEEAAVGPSETASSSAPGPVLEVGETGEFETGEMDESGENYTVTSRMSVKVVDAEYVTAEQVDTGNEPENGQYVKLTLTLKNIGDAPAKIMTYGTMEWEDDDTAPQDASTPDGIGDGRSIDTTYRPGQSATGFLILDVGDEGGTVSYNGSQDPNADGPVFSVNLPES